MKRFFLKLLPIIVILCLGLVIYSNSFDNSFHFDDQGYIIDNHAIRTPNIVSIWNSWLPNARVVAFYTFALNYQYHQLDVFGYHVVNFAIHFLTAVLVWWFMNLILVAPRLKTFRISRYHKSISLLAALLFISHPVQTQAVTYISQRFASLATMFYIATLCFYLKGRMMQIKAKADGGEIFYFFFSAVAAILGMFTKQIVITLPFTVLLTEYCFLRGRNAKEKPFNLIYVLVILLFVFVIPALYSFNVAGMLNMQAHSASHTGDYLTPGKYFLSQSRVIVTYLKILFYPLVQNFDYDFPISQSLFELKTFLSFALLFVILAGAFKLKSRCRLITFGVLWFFITLSVESSVIVIKTIIFEHRLYLPSIGFCIVVCAGVFHLFKRPQVPIAVLSTVILLFSFLTFQRNHVWQDEVTLWEDTVKKSPNKPRALMNLGLAYSKLGKYDLSLDYFNKSIAIDPKNTDALNLRGVIYFQKGKYLSALEDYDQAISVDPYYAEIYVNRGNAFARLGDEDSAIMDYNRAIDLKPHFAEAYVNRGNLYGKKGEYELAIADFNLALRRKPHMSEIYKNRGNAYELSGRYALALYDYDKALEIKSDFPEAYLNRGNTLGRVGLYYFAILDYNRALEIHPEYTEAYHNRGVAYRFEGEHDLALADYNKVLQLNPDHLKAQLQRADIHHIQRDFDQALAGYNRIIDLDPENATVYFSRSMVLQSLGEFNKALEDSRKAKALGAKINKKYIEILEQKVSIE